jgi:hypothetical protein
MQHFTVHEAYSDYGNATHEGGIVLAHFDRHTLYVRYSIGNTAQRTSLSRSLLYGKLTFEQVVSSSIDICMVESPFGE